MKYKSNKFNHKKKQVAIYRKISFVIDYMLDNMDQLLVLPCLSVFGIAFLAMAVAKSKDVAIIIFHAVFILAFSYFAIYSIGVFAGRKYFTKWFKKYNKEYVDSILNERRMK